MSYSLFWFRASGKEKAAWWNFDSDYLHWLSLAFPYLRYFHFPLPKQCQMRNKEGGKKRLQGVFWHESGDFSRQTCEKRIDTDESPWAQADNVWITLIMSPRELLNRQMSQSKHANNQASSVENTAMKGRVSRRKWKGWRIFLHNFENGNWKNGKRYGKKKKQNWP